MASTSNKQQVTSMANGKRAARSPKSPIAPKPKKSKSPMGLDLLLIAIGTSLIGLGGLGYLFYQELLNSSRREIDQSAEVQVRQLEAKLTKVQQNVDGVASAAKVLSQQLPKTRTAANYQGLIIEGLKNTDTLAGMGIASNGNALFTSSKPSLTYVYREQSGLKLEIAGQKLPAPNDKFLLSNRTDLKAPFYQGALKGESSWSEPYTALGKTLITYSVPIMDAQKVVGIANADAIATDLLSLSTNPSSENKIGFVVIDASGKAITASNPQTPATEALIRLSEQAKSAPTGVMQSGGNLWAYRKASGSNLLVATYLPESEITSKLLILVGGAALGISAILAIAVLQFINTLKKRLQPLTEECDRFLSQQQGQSQGAIAGKDEIEHLGLALKSTFHHIKINEVRLRGEIAQGAGADNQSTVAQIQQNLEQTELMEAEVGDLLDVVSSMEEGNLTIEAQVNDRATGLVADTLNRLREKLVEIISSVLGTAQQVAQGASDLEELARTVVLNTAEQAQSVTQGQALTEQVAAIASRSAAQVNVANQSLQEVRDTVASGQTAINTLTDSISVLQTGSAQIVQRMKTLGEFVGLAEQFVQDQGQIASLTQVLALNATLVAARAAEQKDPKQFTSVAREFESIAGQVNDLATQTNDGLTVLQQRTSQIQTVVTAIDTEVQNLSGLVSGFTSGVEESQAAFNSIQDATSEVVQIGLTITASSTEIAEAAGSTASYISEIAKLAERTADLTRSARQQAELMGNQAQQLLQGIQFFQLPADSVPVAPEKNKLVSASITSITDVTPDNANNVAESNVAESFTSNVLEDSTETSYEHKDQGLGLVVPVLGAIAATVAVTSAFSQPEQDNYPSDDLGLVPDIAANPESEEVIALEPRDKSFEAFIEDIGDQDELLPSELNAFPELDDISIIEESMLADLKQEIYDQSLDEPAVEASFDADSQDDLYNQDFVEDLVDNLEVPTLKNPMEGVNESAINEASGDPMIVSATSSFLEDTAFGAPSQLSEEDLPANLPVSVDFSIPDLDDDDFQIPKMDIESTLDDSNSFFDSSIPTQDPASNQFGEDFDPFTMEQNSVGSSIVADDYAIANNINNLDANESVFDLESLSLSENLAGEVFDDFNPNNNPFENTVEDYNDYTEHEAINESVYGYLESEPNEAFNDTFVTPFDETPFDQALDDALVVNDSFNSADYTDYDYEDPSAAFDFAATDLVEEENPNAAFDFAATDLVEEEDPNAAFDFVATDLVEEEDSNAAFDFVATDLTEQEDSNVAFDFVATDLTEKEDSNVAFDFEQLAELSADILANPDELAERNNLNSNIYLAESSDDEMSEELTFDLDNEYSVEFANNLESDALEQPLDVYEGELEFSDPFNFTPAIISDASDNSLTNEFLESADPFSDEQAIASDFSDPQSDFLPQQSSDIVDLSGLSNLETNLPDELQQEQIFEISETLATEDALLDEVFNFDVSSEFIAHEEFAPVPYSLESEPSMELVDQILGDSDLEIDSIFDVSNLGDSLEVATGFESVDPAINNSAFTFEAISDDLEFSNEQMNFNQIVTENSISANTLDISEEVNAFEASNTDSQDIPSFLNPLELMDSDTNGIDSVSGNSESPSDFSLDLSDSWLEDITDDKDDDFADLDDLSIYAPIEDLSTPTLDDSNRGFADNLLDNLMDESDDDFVNLSMDLSDDVSDLPTVSNLLPSFDYEFGDPANPVGELDKEIDFDFSMFDAPISPIRDKVDTARSEIDDFLSGNLDFDQENIVSKNLDNNLDSNKRDEIKADTPISKNKENPSIKTEQI